VAGKLGGRGIVSAVRPGRLFYVTDSSSSRQFLVDTGIAFPLMPWQSESPPSGPSLAGADGCRISCWGQRSFTVSLDGIPRRWDFLLAAVRFPILGANFLRHHSLLMDVANLRLLPTRPSPPRWPPSLHRATHLPAAVLTRRYSLAAGQVFSFVAAIFYTLLGFLSTIIGL
jgi:hypothetical protein